MQKRHIQLRNEKEEALFREAVIKGVTVTDPKTGKPDIDPNRFKWPQHKEEALEVINSSAKAGPAISTPITANSVYADLFPADLSASSTSPASQNRDFMNIPPAEDPLLRLLASMIMKGGKRARANRIVARTMLIIHARTRAPALPIVRQAIFALSPSVKMRQATHGTKVVRTPMPLFEKQSIWQGIKWLKVHVEKGIGQLEEKLAREIILLANGTSKLLDNREKLHKEAMVNRYAVRLLFRRNC
jgi:small subunit ribosomal protein S7